MACGVGAQNGALSATSCHSSPRPHPATLPGYARSYLQCLPACRPGTRLPERGPLLAPQVPGLLRAGGPGDSPRLEQPAPTGGGSVSPALPYPQPPHRAGSEAAQVQLPPARGHEGPKEQAEAPAVPSPSPSTARSEPSPGPDGEPRKRQRGLRTHVGPSGPRACPTGLGIIWEGQTGSPGGLPALGAEATSIRPCPAPTHQQPTHRARAQQSGLAFQRGLRQP